MSESERNTGGFEGRRFYHGGFYHAFIDRYQREARDLVVSLVPRGSSVLDIACGTGELCFELAARKQCRVVGVDLSRKMIEFARSRNRYEPVEFLEGDATHLGSLGQGAFDFASMLFLLHELPRRERPRALDGAQRVARRVVVIDARARLPLNLFSMAWRAVEISSGLADYRLFTDFIEAGGIDAVLAGSALDPAVVQRSVFWHGCREMVMLEARGTRDAVSPL